MKRLIHSVGLMTLMLCLTPRTVVAQASEPYLGEIRIFAFNFCPVGWAAVSGQLLPISQNQALFQLLGTNYGGDGTTTFALPNWSPILTANGGVLRPCIALQGIFPSQN
jgi:microcystin-dependent protein